MIEVEKKFQPTEEQLAKVLEGAEFLGEIVNHDIYYDYPDYRFIKKDEVRLRNRNGNFELKLGLESSGISREIEDEEDIKRYFNTNENLKDFIGKNFIPIIDYTSKRLKYKKDSFSIDVDYMDFGYDLIEIELLVENENEVENSRIKIIDFAKKYNLELKEMLPKRAEYLRLKNPEIYKKIYGDKEQGNELKMK